MDSGINNWNKSEGTEHYGMYGQGRMKQKYKTLDTERCVKI